MASSEDDRMTSAIKKGRLDYQEGKSESSVFLKTGETVSIQNFYALQQAAGFSLEEIDAQLGAVFGKIPLPAEGEAESPTEPCLEKISIENILSVELPPPPMTFAQLVPEGEVTLIGGHGGSGKSIFALTLAAHFACGLPWNGFSPSGGVYEKP